MSKILKTLWLGLIMSFLLITGTAAAASTAPAAIGTIPVSAAALAVTPSMAWSSSSFDASKAKVASGDFDGDGMKDTAILYDYGHATTRLWLMKSTGTTFTSSLAWSSGSGNFDWSKAKMAAGDFNGDGKSDLAIAYDYGSADTGVWIFRSNGTTFTPTLTWNSGSNNFDWSKIKMAAGDVDGAAPARDDLMFLYDYGHATSRIWIMKSNGTTLTPSLAWSSVSGSFDWSKAMITAADYDGNGQADMGILYDYGIATSRLWLMKSNGTTMTSNLAWSSAPGSWDWNRSRIVSGEFSGDGQADIVILYDYGFATSRLWRFKSAGSTMSAVNIWYSGVGDFDAARTQATCGDYDNDSICEVAALYDYGQTASALWLFDDINASFLPTLTWPAPAAITYGTALSSTQLNATASVPGVFVYTPAAGTILNAGAGRALSVMFTPTDLVNYDPVTQTTAITVNKANQAITFGPLGAKAASDPPFTVSATATSGLAVTFSIVSGPATINGNTVTLTGAGTVVVRASQAGNGNYNAAAPVDQSFAVTIGTPTISWPTPADIPYGTALSSTQLNATAGGVSGTFVYTPPAGTILEVGPNQVLSVTFTPTDPLSFNPVTQTTTINVVKASPGLAWVTPSAITYGTPLSSTQLNATAAVAGVFVYTPTAGTVLDAGVGQTLSVTFTPTDTTHYNSATLTTTITVNKAESEVNWTNPADIVYGTMLSSTQLNATAEVPGEFVYTPPSGTLLNAGMGQTLSVEFTPDDETNYREETATVTINVLKADPVITWASPADITYGTPLSSTQLDATSGGVAGAFVYTPPAGTVLNAGAGQTLSVTFTPTNTTNYNSATQTTTITVLKADPVIAWAAPADITWPTPLSSTQLNATSGGVAGAFVYTPPAGTVLSEGLGQTLSVDFTPTDTTNYNSATQTTTINVLPSNEKAIISFSIPTGATTINETAHTVEVAVPGETDVAALVPTITVSPMAFVWPSSGVAQDFTFPMPYLVTAQNGTTQFYQVTVVIDDTGPTGGTLSWNTANHPAVMTVEPTGSLYAAGTIAGPTDSLNGLSVVFTDAHLALADVPVLFDGAANGVMRYTGSGDIWDYWPDTPIILGEGEHTMLANFIDTVGNATPMIVTLPVADITAPVIALNGITPVNIFVDADYFDAGATATDDVDGLFQATATGTVDTHAIGTYTITYNATDAAGNHATPVTRTVNVLPKVSVTAAADTRVLASNGSSTVLAEFLPVLTSPLYRGNDAYYGIRAVTAADSGPSLHWEITVHKASTVLTAGMATLTQKGRYDATSGLVADAAYGPSVVGNDILFTGASGWTTVTGDDFTDVDNVHFNASAPQGDYTVTRRLIDEATGSVISNTYTQTVTVVANPAKAIIGFTIPTGVTIINESAKTIAVSVPTGTDVTALVPTVTVSPLAHVVPASGLARDFTFPVAYLVTADNGTTQFYLVTVTVL